jgi:hypothetical protein
MLQAPLEYLPAAAVPFRGPRFPPPKYVGICIRLLLRPLLIHPPFVEFSVLLTVYLDIIFVNKLDVQFFFIYFWYIMIYFFIFNCNWVATRWQLFSTHIHTNNTENDTKQTIYRTKQKIHRTTQKMHLATKKLRRVRAVPRLCGYHPGICLTTEEKAWENLSSIL